MPVRRRIAHARHPLNVTQFHRVRPAHCRKVDGVLEEGLPQIAMVVGVGGGRGSSIGHRIPLPVVDVDDTNIPPCDVRSPAPLAVSIACPVGGAARSDVMIEG
ncbi:MAG: hypothetical protein AAB196_26130, partial [Pseudomonadota bacterium]